MPKLRLNVIQKISAALPGPVTREKVIGQYEAGELSFIFRLTCRAAKAMGVKTKIITCRRIGVPEQADGSHEARYIVPARLKLPISHATI